MELRSHWTRKLELRSLWTWKFQQLHLGPRNSRPLFRLERLLRLLLVDLPKELLRGSRPPLRRSIGGGKGRHLLR
jgi:hypothetical protein